MFTQHNPGWGCSPSEKLMCSPHTTRSPIHSCRLLDLRRKLVLDFFDDSVTDCIFQLDGVSPSFVFPVLKAHLGDLIWNAWCLEILQSSREKITTKVFQYWSRMHSRVWLVTYFGKSLLLGICKYWQPTLASSLSVPSCTLNKKRLYKMDKKLCVSNWQFDYLWSE